MAVLLSLIGSHQGGGLPCRGSKGFCEVPGIDEEIAIGLLLGALLVLMAFGGLMTIISCRLSSAHRRERGTTSSSFPLNVVLFFIFYRFFFFFNSEIKY